MILPTLYKRDVAGKHRQWSVEAVNGTVIVSHGLVGGKLTVQTTKCEAKNLGRSNATSIYEQSELEARSKWQMQIDREDYHEDIEQAGRQFRPMLAKDYLKVSNQVDWSRTVAQPKIDGLRLNFGMRSAQHTVAEFMSRRGDNYNLPHLKDAALDLLNRVNTVLKDRKIKAACTMLDGEVYYHPWSLQKILSTTKRLQLGTAKLEYYLFDIYIPNMEFSSRHAILEEALQITAPKFPQLKLVLCHQCGSEFEACQLQAAYMRTGFEGAMLRHTDSMYAPGARSIDLFKFKRFMDAECQIIGVTEDLNGLAVLSCTHPETGREFGCTPKRTHAERRAMLQDQGLLGKWITVKYQGLTPDGAPLFPVGLDLRECDESGIPLN